MSTYDRQGAYVLAVCPNPSVDGWAWIDDLRPREVNRMTREEHYPGGKGVHVALAMAELGEPVRLLGFWAGPTGQWIRQECERRYPHLHCIGPTVSGWSRSCYTFQSEYEAVAGTELLGVGPTLQEEDIDAFYQAFDDAVAPCRCVTLSGSWPKQAPDNGYARLIHQARAQGKATLVDCTGPLLQRALAEHPFSVHLNRAETTELFATDGLAEALPLLLAHCDQAAITDGAEGLWLADGQHTVHSRCAVDPVYSAVGSGDCLVAGLAVAFVRGISLPDAARLGAACGAANCRHPELGILKQEDVDQLYKTTELN